MRVYLAGPMKGYDRWNFDAFDAAATWLRDNGYEVISPADLDRQAGIDPDITVPEADYQQFFAAAIRRDIQALLQVDAIVLLPGWESSAGTAVELTVARALGLGVYEVAGQPGAWLHLEPELTTSHLGT